MKSVAASVVLIEASAGGRTPLVNAFRFDLSSDPRSDVAEPWIELPSRLDDDWPEFVGSMKDGGRGLRVCLDTGVWFTLRCRHCP
jgi:hypothetical protein